MSTADEKRAAALAAVLQQHAGVAPASEPVTVQPTDRIVYAGGDVMRLLVKNAPTLGYALPGGSYQVCGAVPGDYVKVTQQQADRLDKLGATLDPDNLPEVEAEPIDPDVVTDDDLAGMKAADLIAYVGQNPDERARVKALEEAKGDKARTTVLEACADTPEEDAEAEARAAALAAQQGGQ